MNYGAFRLFFCRPILARLREKMDDFNLSKKIVDHFSAWRSADLLFFGGLTNHFLTVILLWSGTASVHAAHDISSRFHGEGTHYEQYSTNVLQKYSLKGEL